MDTKKLKMENKKFRAILGIVMAIVLLACIAANIALNFFSVTMETQFGRGERIETVPEGAEGMDTAFYEDFSGELDSNTDAIALRVAEEGQILMKNNGVLPLAQGTAVTPFGYRYNSPVYGGSGSGGVNENSSRITKPSDALSQFFTVNSEIEGVISSDKAFGMNATEYTTPDEESGFEGAGTLIIENEPSIYVGHEASCQGTVGIVFIGRVGGEGSDVTADVEGSTIYGTGYADGTPHQLALSEYEKEMLRFAKANCDSVVVILNSSNVMEIRDLVRDDSDISADAILWIGGPGAQGFKAMGEILSGEVNPSGKTVDTWMSDLSETPSVYNFGNYEYDNTYLMTGGFPNPVGEQTEMNFLEYEENIYVGYRFYETVDATGGSFTVFGEDGKNYDDAVVFPFGYGLSYGADFTQTIESFSEDNDTVTFSVRVTNNGTKAAKDVVQVYYNPPYTQYDIENGIEKATANLIAFDKTDDIAPGASETVDIVIQKEDMASYSYNHENSDGTKGCYILEAGDYEISVNKNSHEKYETVTASVASDVFYENDNPRQSEKKGQALLDDTGIATDTPAKAEADSSATFIAATNKFQDMSDHMAATSQLSRRSGVLMNTATTPTAEDKANVPDYEMTKDGDGHNVLAQTDLSTNMEIGNAEGSKIYVPDAEAPETADEKVMALSSMRGKSYYDPQWDELLDQLDLSAHDLYVALTASYDQTGDIMSVYKPATVDFDGPQGIVGSIFDETEYTAWTSEPVFAATYNVDLIFELGQAVGNEAADAGVNTWYAPASNIHRAPFSGRNFEYYSEDPFLSGKMLTAEVNGCGTQGLIVSIKHFALNDEECYDNDRSRVSIWANEQAIREIYLRPFEMCVKDARMDVKYVDDSGETVSHTVRGTTCVMGCMNYWGTQWGGARYSLLTETLRDEWGFQGYVITDMVMNAGSNSVDQAIRSGSDTWMAWGEAFTTLINDTESATAVTAIRKAVKNMCYGIVNSHTYNHVAPGTTFRYKISPWRMWMYIADVVVALLLVAGIIIIVRRNKFASEHPELFKQSGTR